MEEKAKKEINLPLKLLNRNYLWKYEIHPIKGDEKYFKEEKNII